MQMKKLLVIGWKDLKVAFRDKAAIIMLVAPFALTLAMGAVTGSFSGDGDSGLQDIPLAVVDHDGGPLADALVEVLQSGQKGLFAAEVVEEARARERVEEDEIAAAVIIQDGFSEAMLSPEGGGAAIEIYVNPARAITAGVVRSVVVGFVNELETRVVTAHVAVSQMIAQGMIAPHEAAQVGEEIGVQFESSPALITINTGAPVEEEEDTFNFLAMLAPSMAILFLMYTVSSVGGRSILAEREEWTLQRMLSTPSSTAQVLGGKVFGVFLTGAAQMGILILASSLLFRLSWGNPVAVIALVLAAVVGASGWGILLAAFAKTPTQVSSVGTALMLLFGILGGSFFGGASFPGLLGTISKITPNAWAQEGFLQLVRGGGLGDILTPIGALLIMGLVLFGAAVWAFRRYGLTQR
jgi:ABC-2 type transport system permease protein